MRGEPNSDSLPHERVVVPLEQEAVEVRGYLSERGGEVIDVHGKRRIEV